MSEIASILSNYRQTMPEAGGYLKEGIKGYLTGKKYRADEAKAEAEADKLKADADKSKFDQVIETLKGPIAAANTPEKWVTAQQSGFIPKEMGFESREPFIMGHMTDLATKTTEIGDTTSPTGTRVVRTMDAIGQPGKPKSGTSLSVDKEGNVTFKQGVGVGGGDGDMTKPTMNKVQGKILDIGDTMQGITAIKQSFKPEYQQVGARMGFAWDAMKDKFSDTPLGSLTGELKPEEAAALEDFTSYRASAAQNFSTTLKQMSGVAVNPTEFKRTEAWLPNPGTGVFDGDSPAELKAKIQRFEDFTRKALAKYSYINKHGVTPMEKKNLLNTIDVDDMPQMMNKRGNELEASYMKQGLTGEELKTAVRAALADEFGLAQ